METSVLLLKAAPIKVSGELLVNSAFKKNCKTVKKEKEKRTNSSLQSKEQFTLKNEL